MRAAFRLFNATAEYDPRIGSDEVALAELIDVIDLKVILGQSVAPVDQSLTGSVWLGEVLAIRVEDLNHLGRRLHVSRQSQTLPGWVVTCPFRL